LLLPEAVIFEFGTNYMVGCSAQDLGLIIAAALLGLITTVPISRVLPFFV